MGLWWLISCQNVSLYILLAAMVFGFTNEGDLPSSNRLSIKNQRLEDQCGVSVGCYLYKVVHPLCGMGYISTSRKFYTIRLAILDCNRKSMAASFIEWRLLSSNGTLLLNSCQKKIACRFKVQDLKNAVNRLKVQVSHAGFGFATLHVILRVIQGTSTALHGFVNASMPEEFWTANMSSPFQDLSSTNQILPDSSASFVSEDNFGTKHTHRRVKRLPQNRDKIVISVPNYPSQHNVIQESDSHTNNKPVHEVHIALPNTYTAKHGSDRSDSNGQSSIFGDPEVHVLEHSNSKSAVDLYPKPDLNHLVNKEIKHALSRARAKIFHDITKNELSELQEIQLHKHLPRPRVLKSDGRSSHHAPTVIVINPSGQAANKDIRYFSALQKNGRRRAHSRLHQNDLNRKLKRLKDIAGDEYFQAWKEFLLNQHVMRLPYQISTGFPLVHPSWSNLHEPDSGNENHLAVLEAALRNFVQFYGYETEVYLESLYSTVWQKISAPGRVYRMVWDTAYSAMLHALHDTCPLLPHPERKVSDGWSTWGLWEPCSQSCGSAFRVRRRRCQSPDDDCDGGNTEYQECQNPACPATWLHWSEWSPCSSTCGVGYHSRQRVCLTQSPELECIGVAVVVEDCPGADCWQPVLPPATKSGFLGQPVGAWSAWTAWGHCSVTCGNGRQLRQRVCSLAHCEGHASEARVCSVGPCDSVYFSSYVEVDEGKDAQLKCSEKNIEITDVYWRTPHGLVVRPQDSNGRYKFSGTMLWVPGAQVADRGMYRCVLNRGSPALFISDSALEVLDCNSSPCQNGGTCVEETDPVNPNFRQFSCICFQGHSGIHCEKEFPWDYIGLILGVIGAVLLLNILLFLFCLLHRKYKKKQNSAGKTNKRPVASFTSSIFSWRLKRPRTIEPTYDTQGKIVNYRMVGPTGKRLGELPFDYSYKPIYSAEGSIVSYDIVNSNGKVLCSAPEDLIYHAVHDDEGNVIGYNMEDMNGRHIGPAPLIIDPITDSTGRITGYHMIDKKGNVIGPAPLNAEAKLMGSISKRLSLTEVVEPKNSPVIGEAPRQMSEDNPNKPLAVVSTVRAGVTRYKFNSTQPPNKAGTLTQKPREM